MPVISAVTLAAQEREAVSAMTLEASTAQTNLAAQTPDQVRAGGDLRALPPDHDGTAAAKQPATMKNADNMNFIAGRAEQLLPPSAFSAAALTDQVLADARKDSTIPTSSKFFAPFSPHTPPAWIFPTNEDLAVTAPTTVETSAAALAHAPDRAQELIQEHAIQFKQLGAHSMSVVLKPDAQTELFLHLTLRHGLVEARAELGEGDFAALSAHWPALQEKLAEHGVRVTPLAREPGLDANADAGFAHSQSRREQIPDEAASLLPLPKRIAVPSLPNLPTQSEPILVTAASRSWHTWA